MDGEGDLMSSVAGGQKWKVDMLMEMRSRSGPLVGTPAATIVVTPAKVDPSPQF
jgi:hypothetical protein